MIESDSGPREPSWLWQTKRLFPHPIFAGCISSACLLVTIIFIAVTISERIWPMAIASVGFLAATYATGVAAITLAKERKAGIVKLSADPQPLKPTFAVLVLLIGVYSWLLTIAMHVFDVFIANGPGTGKYYLTLGIAIAATLFMQFYGKHIVREHFGARGGRNLTISSRQAGYVVVFVLGITIYLLWVLW